MKAFDIYNLLDAKLTKLLMSNSLVHKLYPDRYPLVLVIRPDQDIEAQMAMVASDDGGSSPDASLAFSISADGLSMKINGRLLIDEDLMNKIKNLVKKLVTAYLFGHFAERFTKNGDDINYSGTPEDTNEPDPSDEEECNTDEPEEISDESAEDTTEDADEGDPFAEFFGDDALAEDEDAE